MNQDTYGRYTGFVNYYIHQVNLIRHLLGEPYDVTFADKADVLLVGESKSGVTCTLEMSPYSTSIDWQEHALVCFEHGWIRIELPAPLASNRPGNVEIYRDPAGGKGAPQLERPALPWIGAMRQQAKNFIAAIKGRIPPMTGAEEALEDLKIARKYIRLRHGK